MNIEFTLNLWKMENAAKKTFRNGPQHIYCKNYLLNTINLLLILNTKRRLDSLTYNNYSFLIA